MKKILIVVRGFYPEISASGNLIKPLVEELSKDNFIIVLSSASYQQETFLNKNLIIKKIKVYKSKNIFFNRIKEFINKNLSIQYYDKDIFRQVKVEIEKLNKIYSLDAIIAVTYEEILALMQTNINKYNKFAFILEKLPVYSTIKIPIINNLKIKKRKKIEKLILHELRGVFLLPIVFKYFEENHDANKKKNIIKLEHPMVTNRVVINHRKNDTIKFIYAGGLDKKQRNPLKVIYFFDKLTKLVNIELHIYSYGNMQKKLKKLSMKRNYLYINNPIEVDLLNKKINECDFIITIGNKEKDIMPSKIFDCISTGKPIIHFSQIQEDPYKQYLYKYKNSIILDYDSLNCNKSIDLLNDFIKKSFNKIVMYNDIHNYFIECTPEFVAKQILHFIDSSINLC